MQIMQTPEDPTEDDADDDDDDAVGIWYQYTPNESSGRKGFSVGADAMPCECGFVSLCIYVSLCLAGEPMPMSKSPKPDKLYFRGHYCGK